MVLRRHRKGSWAGLDPDPHQVTAHCSMPNSPQNHNLCTRGPKEYKTKTKNKTKTKTNTETRTKTKTKTKTRTEARPGTKTKTRVMKTKLHRISDKAKTD
jgi:carbohydrate-binding DOMON domain-containing protein